MREKLLTIAIPTYNRHGVLSEQIESILPQITNEIEIIVYDNNSMPEVAESIGVLCAGKIEIVKNSVNIGADANICRCFELCKTKWLWVLSDDDIVNGNAVSIVINAIKKNYDSVFINFKAVSCKITVGLDGFCESKPDYANSFCISLCLYNNYKLKPYIFYYYHHLSSWHGQLIVVLKYLEENSNGICSFLSDEIISVYHPTEWSKIGYIERLPIFLCAFKGRSLELVKSAFGERIVFHLLMFLTNLRIYDGLGRRDQVLMFVKAMAPFGIKNILTPTNLKQMVLFVVAFVNGAAVGKIKTIYKYFQNRVAN